MRLVAVGIGFGGFLMSLGLPALGPRLAGTGIAVAAFISVLANFASTLSVVSTSVDRHGDEIDSDLRSRLATCVAAISIFD